MLKQNQHRTNEKNEDPAEVYPPCVRPSGAATTSAIRFAHASVDLPYLWAFNNCNRYSKTWKHR